MQYHIISDVKRIIWSSRKNMAKEIVKHDGKKILILYVKFITKTFASKSMMELKSDDNTI